MNPASLPSSSRARRILPAGCAAAILGLAPLAPAFGQAQPTSPPLTPPPADSPRPTDPIPAEPRPAPRILPSPDQATTDAQSADIGNVLLPPPGLGAPTTTYVEANLPTAPWLPPEAPRPPEWVAPGEPETPFVRPGFGTSALGDPALPVANPPGVGYGPVPPLQLGPFDLRPSLGYGVRYGTGIASGPGREDATWLHTIDPAVTINAGDHWTVTYQPSIRIYSDDAYDTSVNHTITLGGWATWENWRFRLNHATAISDDPLIETARQTDQTTHSTSIGATWDRGPRGSFDFSLNQNIRTTEDQVDARFGDVTDAYSWSTQNWYDYPFSDRLSAGVGVGAGYDSIDPGSDMTNERLNARILGRLGKKIRYTLSGGAEFRQFSNSDASTSVSPLAEATLRYQILQKTALSIGASHDVNVSYFSNQITENTSFQAGVYQTLTDRWRASVTGGYRFTEYQSTFGGNDVEREDNTGYANVSLSGRLFPRVTLTVFYAYRANGSDISDYDLDSHQVGLRVNWTL